MNAATTMRVRQVTHQSERASVRLRPFQHVESYFGISDISFIDDVQWLAPVNVGGRDASIDGILARKNGSGKLSEKNIPYNNSYVSNLPIKEDRCFQWPVG